MDKNKRLANGIFGSVLVFLGTVAGISMYVNLNRPVIQEAPAARPVADAQLPEDHPPIDSAAKLASLEQKIRNEPRNADYRIQIGNIYFDLGQYQKAATAYEEGLKLHPGDPGVETDLATCYHSTGQHDKALQLLEEVLKDHPGFAQALYNKGIVLQAGKNDVKGAIAAWETLLQSNPNLPQKNQLLKKIDELKSAAR
jgi:cytochrome c-type biogenesis protein CcmH/NrfG